MSWTLLARVFGAAPWRSARALGTGIDLVRSTGPGYAWRRWSEQRARATQAGIAGAAFYREIWTEAAAELGAELVELGGDFLELRDGGTRARVWHQWLPLEDIATHRLALDKPRVHRLLVEAGLPVPEHVEFPFAQRGPALDFLARVGAPCVVKPASGTGSGSGVTAGVRSRTELLRARLRASRDDERLLIERQAEGDFYRLLFLDGQLLDVVRRLPPRVTGDGRSTIAELIASENQRRLEGGGRAGLRLLTVDLECVLALEHQGLNLRSVPEAGVAVPVKAVVSQNAPRENETVRDSLAPGLIAEGASAARAVGLRLAGVDVITRDLSRPLAETGGVILEVNGTPGFRYHYQVADPDRATRIAVPILRALLSGRDETVTEERPTA